MTNRRRPTYRALSLASLVAGLVCVGAAAALVATLAAQIVERGRYPIFEAAPPGFLLEWAGAATRAALPWAAGLSLMTLCTGLVLRRMDVGRWTRIAVLAAPSLVALLLVAWASETLREAVEDDRPVRRFLPLAQPYEAASTDTSGAGAGGTDLVLVTVDTLRADHLGHFGYGRDTSPTLDALAARGVSFRQAVAPAPMTRSSVAAMMVSQPVHAVQDDVYRGLKVRGAFVREGFELLAERLRAAGYDTAGFIANRHLKRDNGFAQGFDTFDEVSGMFGSDPVGRKKHAGHVVDAALDWLRERPESRKPIFLWLHVLDPHQPYEPVEPGPWEDVESETFRAFRDQYETWTVPKLSQHLIAMRKGQRPLRDGELDFLVGRYDAEILQVDRHLGRFLDGWRDAGRDADDTLFVVTSDHGEEFYDHGGFLHSHTLFDELIHVPLVLAGPGFRGGQKAAGQVSLLDVAPTLLRAAGVETRTVSGLAGRPLQEVNPERGSGPALAFLARRKVALRTEQYKILSDLRILEPGCPSGEPWPDLERLYRARYVPDSHWPDQIVRAEVFDLEADPDETTHVEDPWVLHRMACTYGKTLRSFPPLDAGLGGGAGLSEEDKESLRALGYVVD